MSGNTKGDSVLQPAKKDHEAGSSLNANEPSIPESSEHILLTSKRSGLGGDVRALDKPETGHESIKIPPANIDQVWITGNALNADTTSV